MSVHILAAHFVTEETIGKLQEQYPNLMPTHPGNTTELAVGDAIITQMILTEDLFEPGAQNVSEHHWLCTAPEFADRFYVLKTSDDGTSAVIRLK
jgi:hypothetical protein